MEKLTSALSFMCIYMFLNIILLFIDGTFKKGVESLWNHSFQMYHPEHGVQNVTKAEKIEGKHIWLT